MACNGKLTMETALDWYRACERTATGVFSGIFTYAMELRYAKAWPTTHHVK